jgi:N-hydroxyarylamine O-acetyltransferase
MLAPADLAAYLARIGHAGEVAPTRATLAALQLAHVCAIPFETLDSLTGRAPALDLPALMDKLVRSRRGGYCFEHNRLFKAALEAVGFRPVGLLGRVFLGEPEDAEPARTHMLLRVPCEGEDLIADVGFGGQVLTGPIRLVPGLVQETPHEPYRLDEERGLWSLRALVGGEWRLLYRFTLEPALPIDYEVGNHYVATHPASFFTRALVAARILPRGRLTLLNRRLTEHRLGEPSRSHEIADSDWRGVLAERFGIEVDDAMWRAAAERVASVG